MLEFKDATIRVDGKVLVSHFSLIADDGQITCVTGPEQSGKTVLIRTLMGFLPVSEGFVSVDGELLTVSSAHAFRRMMVYLPQQLQLLTHQLHQPEPEEPELEEYAVWNRLLPPAARECRPEVLGPDDILLLAEQTLNEAADKPIVIADEPAACLTPELTARLTDMLRRQADAGKTVLIASRKPQVVDCADQVVRLEKR